MAIYLGNTKIVGDINQVPPHASSHETNGSDPITPENIGAANIQHTHEYAKIPSTQTITIPLSSWTSYSFGYNQTVSVDGMRGSSLVIITPHPDSYDSYVKSRVRCTVQGWGALTFACKEMPDSDLSVNIMILG